MECGNAAARLSITPEHWSGIALAVLEILIEGAPPPPIAKREERRPAGLKPQTKQVAAYLRKYGSITPLKARAEINVESLSRRIVDLKEAGYGIEKVLEKNMRGRHYAKYVLKTLPDGSTFSAASALR